MPKLTPVPNTTTTRTKRQTRLHDAYMVEHGKLNTLENMQRYLLTIIVEQAKKTTRLQEKYRRSMGWEPLGSKLDFKDTLLRMVRELP